MKSAKEKREEEVNLQSCYRVFVALPFDGSMLPMYEKIRRELTHTFQKRFEFIWGNDDPTQSRRPLTIELFKNQNIDLLEQFYFSIRSSDIIIADLTNNNPNVHVELGIALTLNKNILRVSGRDLGELGSDVKGYDTRRYRNEKELRNQIEKYFRIFLSIKELPLSKKAGRFYKIQFYQEQQIKHGEIMRIISMRDGALKVKFKFKKAKKEDWFGVFLRSSRPNPWMGGYLLYVRKDGSLELAGLPVNILKKKKYAPLKDNEEHTLHLGIDGDVLAAYLDGNSKNCLRIRDLDDQSSGDVYLSSHGRESTIVFKEVETVIRDTVNFDLL